MTNESTLRLGLPKGRIQENVLKLLKEAGIDVEGAERSYRPTVSIPNTETKIMKPQNIIEMIDAGSRDIGFGGADWVQELNAEVVELLDTGMNPVRIVAAAPTSILVDGKLPDRKITIASEYVNLTNKWIKDKNLDANFLRAYGATEVFPPDDADCIVDNTSTGSTLRANNLDIVDTLMTSSTRLFANPRALENKAKLEQIENIKLLLESVLEARKRVMLELNVSSENLEKVVAILPAMNKPTVSTLHNQSGYSVRAAIKRKDMSDVIPAIKSNGGTDIVVTKFSNIVP